MDQRADVRVKHVPVRGAELLHMPVGFMKSQGEYKDDEEEYEEESSDDGQPRHS
jgi:hypothetical protein